MLRVQASVTFPQAVVVEPPPPSTGRYFRVLHDWEIARRQATYPGHGQLYHPDEGWAWRAVDGSPEVFWLLGTHKVPFDERWQRLSYAMNPGMKADKWREVYNNFKAFMNRTGFWTSNSPYPNLHCQDFINGIDVGGNNPLPAWDKIRVAGGMTLRGVVDGDTVIVETLHYDDCPTWDWLQARPWLYFRAVTVHERKDKSCAIYDFPQNSGKPVLVPLVAIHEVRYPLAALEEVGGIADPYKIYIG